MRYLIPVLVIVFSFSGCGGSGSSSIIPLSEDDSGNNNDGIDTITTGLILNQTIEVYGLIRDYHLYVPQNYSNAPIVMLFHGHSKSSSDMIGLGDQASPYETWLDIAERENIIVVVPNGFNNGTDKGWNDCRNDSLGNSNEDDVAFTRILVDWLLQSYQADPARVYATGTSNGGHFSIRLGLEMADKLTAFAAIVAANSVNTKCLPSNTAVSALFMNGTDDPFLPYDGGQMVGDRGVVYSAADTVSDWVIRNGADEDSINLIFQDIDQSDGSTVTRHEYLNGDNNTAVVLYRVAGGGHAEPSIQTRLASPIGNQNGDIEMAEEVWSFFRDKTK